MNWAAIWATNVGSLNYAQVPWYCGSQTAMLSRRAVGTALRTGLSEGWNKKNCANKDLAKIDFVRGYAYLT